MTEGTVLVTGATGFIGGRLVQRLALEEQWDVRPLVHRFSGPGSMRLARLPIDIEQGSVTDRSRMDAVIDNCDAVVHCAVGTRKTIVEGTRTLVEAAIDADIDTFVHMSSAAVHGHDFDGIVREESPFDPDTSYGRWKMAVERELDDRTDGTALDPTILRPFIVYGPYGEFVTDPIEDIRSGAVLAEGGYGPVNQVYVDNLVDAIELALSHPSAPGETFLVRDDEDVTWRQYYDRLASFMGDVPSFRDASRRRIRARNAAGYLGDNVLPPFYAIKRTFTAAETQHEVAEAARRMPWAMGLFVRLPEPVRRGLQGFVGNGDTPVFPAEHESDPSPATYEMPSQRYARLHASEGRVSNRKIKEMLGWEQRTSFDDSMDMIEEWASFVELT